MTNTTLLPPIETYVSQYFANNPRPDLAYHTLAHTREVVRAAEQLARHEQLSETDFQALIAAAWFHDLGYLTGPASGHEAASADLAARYLQEVGWSAEQIASVRACILATRMPQSPTNRLEEILCDADMFHLAADDYNDRQKKLRKERERLTGQEISGREWRQQNIALLEQHRYFTPYAQALLQKGQADNLHRLREKQAEKESERQPEPLPAANAPVAQSEFFSAVEPDSEPVKKKKDKDGKPERGIETMFRTTSTNHLRLSEIADSKANIMISVNSIMVSVLVSILPRRIEEVPALIVPTVLFLSTAVLTIIFSILATRPNVTQGTFTHDDITQKKGNLLFFGNFHNMSLSEYEWGIGQLMSDSNYLYSTMTRDIYFLGQVLSKKYKLLRIAYNTFMFGFVVSVLAFVAVFLFFMHKG